jgi:hypothetical protein
MQLALARRRTEGKERDLAPFRCPSFSCSALGLGFVPLLRESAATPSVFSPTRPHWPLQSLPLAEGGQT